MPLIRFLVGVVRSNFDARTIALTRIAVGLAATGQGLLTWYMLIQLYQPTTARMRLFPWVPDLTDGFVSSYLLVWLLASVCFTIGFLTPVAGWSLTALLAYQLLLDLNAYSNHVYLLMLCTLLLTAARSGTAISVDAARGAARASRATVPYPFVFLLQFQLTVVYVFTAIHKTNPTFLSGWVLQQSLIFGSPDHDPTLYRVLAVTVILTELFLPIALWMKSLRPWAFLVGAGLHLSLPLLVFREWPDLLVFSVITLGLYWTFLPRVPERLTVVWDDHCSFCAGWIRLFRLLDWLRTLDVVGSSNGAALERLRISHDEADEEIKVVANGRVYGGYDGVARIAAALPLTVFFAALMQLPPVRAAGRRMYRWVAARRKCTYTPSTVH